MMRTAIVLSTIITLALAGCGKGKDDKGGANKAPAKPAAKAATPSTGTAADIKVPEPAPAAEPPVTVALDALGLQIDAPAGWKVKELAGGTYSFDIKDSNKRGGVKIMSTLTIAKKLNQPASVDALAKNCSGKVIDKQSLDGGAFVYVCEQQAAGQAILNFEYRVALGEGGPISCAGGGADVSPLIAVCKTLRAK